MLSHNRFDRATILFIGLLVISFLLTTIDVRASGAGIGETLRSGTQSVFTPVQKAVSAVTRPVVGFIDGVANVASLRADNRRLQRDLELLEQQVAETEQLWAQLTALQEAAGLETPENVDTVIGRVVAVSPSSFDNIRRIDRGLRDGVAEGMTVVDERGLVGRIVQPVNDRSATVRLITDPRSQVGVRVVRTGEFGWVKGTGRGRLVLTMAGAASPLEEGDLVVTGGGRFTPGIPVGTVAESAVAQAGFILETTVAPRVGFSEVEFVVVLLTTEGDEPIEDTEDENRARLEEETPADEEGGEAPAAPEPGEDEAP